MRGVRDETALDNIKARGTYLGLFILSTFIVLLLTAIIAAV